MIIKNPKFTIYFGNAQDNIHKAIDCVPSNVPLVSHKKFESIAKKLDLKHLAFLNQTHSNQGIEVIHTMPAFDYDGDFLITRKPAIGIGVMTADCLPIIICDPNNHAVAAIHAGWRGAVAGIIQNTLAQLREIGSPFEELQVFFGPSAKRCCYQVAKEFEDNFSNALIQKVFLKKNNSHYFDLPLFARLQLQGAGVRQIFDDYNHCTLCDHFYFSYRRQSGIDGRQMSIISLNV